MIQSTNASKPHASRHRPPVPLPAAPPLPPSPRCTPGVPQVCAQAANANTTPLYLSHQLCPFSYPSPSFLALGVPQVCAQAANANPLYLSYKTGFKEFHP